MRKKLIWDRGGTRARMVYLTTRRDYLYAALVLIALALIIWAARKVVI
jgi:hypothetical protein